MINIADNFQGWLIQQKKFWKKFKPEYEMEKKLKEKNQKSQNTNIIYLVLMLKIHLKKIRFI